MRNIDIHSHLLPQCMWQALDSGHEWYGMKYGSEDKSYLWVREGRNGRIHPKVRLKPEDRIQEMDAIGTDLQVVSVHTQIFGYHLSPSDGLAQAQEINNEISSMAKKWPDRFAGMATLPMQDIDASIKELARAVNILGLKGAELDTVVNNKNWDEPEFLPLFKAAESLGAVLFYHPNPQHNLMAERTTKLNMPNSLGVPMEDALITATLICSGVLEKCPDLKVCIAHGGGPACYLMGRIDRGWRGNTAEQYISSPPSSYQRKLYYDCVVMSEATLRFLIDQVGADRVVLGSDWPFVPWDPNPVGWIQGLSSLTQNEKDLILSKNLEGLLNLG